jgi:hypothetical protein
LTAIVGQFLRWRYGSTSQLEAEVLQFRAETPLQSDIRMSVTLERGRLRFTLPTTFSFPPNVIVVDLLFFF